MSEKKFCALTFDDGPNSKLTPLILNKLEKHHVVATFFMVGQLINDETKPVIDRITAMHCEIGNHSWGFQCMNQMTPAQIIESINKTSDAIKKYIGKEPNFFRPPNLAINNQMFKNITLPFAGGVLGYDWTECHTDAKTRAENVLNDMKDASIILLHDVQPEPHPTPEALDILIPALKKMEYEFVTLSELFQVKGIDPKIANKDCKVWKVVE